MNCPEMAKFPPLLRLLIFVPFQTSGRCKKLYAEYKVNIYDTKVTFVMCLICIDVWCIVFWVINILPKKRIYSMFETDGEFSILQCEKKNEIK